MTILFWRSLTGWGRQLSLTMKRSFIATFEICWAVLALYQLLLSEDIYLWCIWSIYWPKVQSKILKIIPLKSLVMWAVWAPHSYCVYCPRSLNLFSKLLPLPYPGNTSSSWAELLCSDQSRAKHQHFGKSKPIKYTAKTSTNSQSKLVYRQNWA